MSQYYENQNLDYCKSAIKQSCNDTTASFVKIGYFLKQIRDRELFTEDGYHDIWQFAETEFGISKSTASRFMAINDRFSVDGNSPTLLPEYADFSSSKLSEMLTLSDKQLEQVKPETTIKQIREMKPSKPKKEKDVPKDDGYTRRSNDKQSVAKSQQSETDIDALELSVSTYNVLRRAGISTVEELREKSEDELIAIRSLGKRQLDEIHEKLKSVDKQSVATSQQGVFLSELDKLIVHATMDQKPVEVKKILSECNLEDAVNQIPKLFKIHSVHQDDMGEWRYEKISGMVYRLKCTDEYRCLGWTKVVEALKRVYDSGTVLKEPDFVTNECENVTDNVVADAEYKEVTEPKKQVPDKWYYLVPIGRKDCTGVEIREGDILESQIDRPSGTYQVAWEPRKLAFIACKPERIGTDTLIMFPPEKLQHTKIIGNVHDSEEIITQCQEPEPDSFVQPELPILKNNDQRKAWIEQYQNWPVWIDQTLTGEKYYRYDFDNGVSFVVKVSECHKWNSGYNKDTEYAREKYFIIGKVNDNSYQPKNPTFCESEVNKSAMIDYLKEFQKGGK